MYEDKERVHNKSDKKQNNTAKEVARENHLPIGRNQIPSVNQRKSMDASSKNDTGLPNQLKTGIERLSGMSMDDVKVHYNSSRPSKVQALAFTQGTQIHVAPGQEQHLAHEAWHVVQQKQGRVQPTTRVAGESINDNAVLEHEADVMGSKALRN